MCFLRCSSTVINYNDVHAGFHHSELDVFISVKSEEYIQLLNKKSNLRIMTQNSLEEIRKVIPTPSNNSSMKVPSPDTTQKKLFISNIRWWWKMCKYHLVRIFTDCMCCV